MLSQSEQDDAAGKLQSYQVKIQGCWFEPGLRGIKRIFTAPQTRWPVAKKSNVAEASPTRE